MPASSRKRARLPCWCARWHPPGAKIGLLRRGPDGLACPTDHEAFQRAFGAVNKLRVSKLGLDPCKHTGQDEAAPPQHTSFYAAAGCVVRSLATSSKARPVST